jgi:hypothetical protein
MAAIDAEGEVEAPGGNRAAAAGRIGGGDGIASAREKELDRLTPTRRVLLPLGTMQRLFERRRNLRAP